MHDVTDSILMYREAMRSLWNTYFLPTAKSSTPPVNLDEFDQIDELLFRSLVLRPIDREADELRFRESAIPYLQLRPAGEGDFLRLRVCDPPRGRSRSWNEAVNVPGIQGALFEFIELFEWNRWDWVSFPYYRVRIDKLPEASGLETLEALVEVQMARIFFRDDIAP